MTAEALIAQAPADLQSFLSGRATAHAVHDSRCGRQSVRPRWRAHQARARGWQAEAPHGAAERRRPPWGELDHEARRQLEVRERADRLFVISLPLR
jgi:hypothetical protein